jgi:Phosphopantetheine attachment site
MPTCDYALLIKQVSMPDLLEHATLQSLAALLERRSCNSPTAIHTTDGTTNANSSSSSSSRALSATEKALAAVWASVLRMDAASAAAVIKRDSDFFDLGGHSLLLVKVAAGVETDMGVQASHFLYTSMHMKYTCICIDEVYVCIYVYRYICLCICMYAYIDLYVYSDSHMCIYILLYCTPLV